MAYSDDTIALAKTMYLMGAPIGDIVAECQLNSRSIVYNWIKKFKWNDDLSTESLKLKTSRRLNWLIDKDVRTKAELDDIDRLGDLLLKLEKATAYERGDIDHNNVRGRKPHQKNGTGKKKKNKKNDVSHITSAMLDEIEERVFYPHQKIWLKAGRDPKTNLMRFILKSRQIGATYTFAWEAFRSAIELGNQQIFISSTKAQAEVFKSYIFLLAQEHFDIELSGNPTKLHTSHGTVEIHYLSPNSYANSRSGDTYFDEVFYTRSFAKMEAVAAPMATLDGFKQTYFGAPTSISHDAYKVWSGERFTKHHPDVSVDVSDHAALYHGRLDKDGFWRCVCTVDSAIEMGWDKVTLERLRIKTPDPDQFDNIYRCKFIDDSESVFKLSELLACGVDPLSWFPDFDPENEQRPAGDIPTSLGYDPAGTGDNAAVSVVSIPSITYDKFRLFGSENYRGIVSSIQAQRIVDLNRKFNIEYLDIDKSGPGLFVPGEIEQAMVEQGFDMPRMVAKQYSVESKAVMVQKALNVISQRRFEYDESDRELPLSFMSIHQSTTEKTGQITYYSKRSKDHGHGDKAWATMHAFMCEPLNYNAHRNEAGSSVVFSD